MEGWVKTKKVFSKPNFDDFAKSCHSRENGNPEDF